MNLTIDRSKWRCGGGPDGHHGKGITVLLNEQGYQCCLGFYCQALGIPSSDIKFQSSPSNVDMLRDIDFGKLVDAKRTIGQTFNSLYSQRAMTINDDIKLTDSEREERLISLAAANGDCWEFVGAFVDAFAKAEEVTP